MSKVWLKTPSDDFGYWTSEVSSEEVCRTQYEDFKDAVPFVQLTPSVSRKLELFDEAVEVIRKYKNIAWITGGNITRDESMSAQTFLKKLGE